MKKDQIKKFIIGFHNFFLPLVFNFHLNKKDMKKYILGALLTLTTCITFGNTIVQNPTPNGDKPLIINKVVNNPSITWLEVSRGTSPTSGGLYIAFNLSESTGDQTWRAVITVRTKFGINTWWYLSYTIDVPPNHVSAGESFSTLSGTTYIWAAGGNPAPNGVYVVDGSQVTITSWQPL